MWCKSCRQDDEMETERSRPEGLGTRRPGGADPDGDAAAAKKKVPALRV